MTEHETERVWPKPFFLEDPDFKKYVGGLPVDKRKDVIRYFAAAEGARAMSGRPGIEDEALMLMTDIRKFLNQNKTDPASD